MFNQQTGICALCTLSTQGLQYSMRFLTILVVAFALDSALAVQSSRVSEALQLSPIDSIVDSEFPELILLDETTGKLKAGDLSPLRGCTDLFCVLFSGHRF